MTSTGIVELWSTRDGARHGIAAHDSPISPATVSLGRQILVTGGDDGAARVWKLSRRGGEVSRMDLTFWGTYGHRNQEWFTARGKFLSAKLSPQKKYLGLSFDYGNVRLVDAETWQTSFAGRSADIWPKLTFAENNHAAVTSDGHVSIIDPEAGRIVRRLPVPKRFKDEFHVRGTTIEIDRPLNSWSCCTS